MTTGNQLREAVAGILLSALEARGVVFTLQENALRYTAPDGGLDARLLWEMRQHKEELIALLRKNDPPWTPEETSTASETPKTSMPATASPLDRAARIGSDDTDDDPFPSAGYHPAFPPAACCTEGSPTERVRQALDRWAPAEGWDLHTLAFRAGLDMDTVRPAVRDSAGRGWCGTWNCPDTCVTGNGSRHWC